MATLVSIKWEPKHNFSPVETLSSVTMLEMYFLFIQARNKVDAASDIPH